MEYKCPHCGADLPENAVFCPHCAKDIHPRKAAKKPVPLLKKLLLALLALAVLAAVGFGLWAVFAPRTYRTGADHSRGAGGPIPGALPAVCQRHP